MIFDKWLQQFSQSQFFENLTGMESFACKKMFGGLSLYFNGKLVALLVESPGETTWNKTNFSFEIWNGVLLPTEHCYHESLLDEFKSLVQHPVLKKWVYLPIQSENYESEIELISKRIQRGDERLGILPKVRKRKVVRKKKIVQRNKIRSKKK